jgi:hypothetical protein
MGLCAHIYPLTLPFPDFQLFASDSIMHRNGLKHVSISLQSRYGSPLFSNHYLPRPESRLASGNNLGNECVAEILSTLSRPEAPLVRQMDLSTNTRLNWRVSVPIAAALGLEAGPRESSAPEGPPVPLPEYPIQMLHLSRLIMSGVSLTDKGAAILAEAVKTNKILKVRQADPPPTGLRSPPWSSSNAMPSAPIQSVHNATRGIVMVRHSS